MKKSHMQLYLIFNKPSLSIPQALKEAEVKKSHQQLYLIFNKPSLLNGVKFKHRFEDGSLKWYEGHISSYRGGQLNLYYHETDKNGQFLVEELRGFLFRRFLYYVIFKIQ